MGVYGLVIGNVTFALVVCILNWIAIGKTLNYHQEVRTTFVLPFCASVLMALAARGIYQGVYFLSGSNAVSVCIAVILAILIYGVLIIKIGAVKEEELRQMPMGTRLARFLK